jgi:hypothetical protein
MALKSAIGSFPVPPTLTARSRAMNTGMFEILWSGSIGDKAPEVRFDTRGTL